MQPPLILRILALLGILSLTAALPASVIQGDCTTHNTTIINADTANEVPQFPATDGGAGVLNRIIWVVFSTVIALPMGAAGVRLGRIATGVGSGLVMAFSVWVAFVNTLPTPFDSDAENSDLILTVIVISTFVTFTFLGAFIHTLRPYGLGFLGICAGATFFIRITIIKAGLLIPIYTLDIILVALGVLLGLIAILWKRRLAVIVSTALLSTFFGGLALDLAIHMHPRPGEGFGRGLALLLDRNPAHKADLFEDAYIPTIVTQIIIGVSIAIIPVLGYLQHRLYPGEGFEYMLRRDRLRQSDSMDFNDGDIFQPDVGVGRMGVPQTLKRRTPNWGMFQSRFSDFSQG